MDISVPELLHLRAKVNEVSKVNKNMSVTSISTELDRTKIYYLSLNILEALAMLVTVRAEVEDVGVI